MKTCPDCGCRVYEFGCVNCNEEAYIERQRLEDYDREPPDPDGEAFRGTEAAAYEREQMTAAQRLK